MANRQWPRISSPQSGAVCRMVMSECPSSPLGFPSHQIIHRHARVLFKAGKNRDGWFGSDQLLTQVDQVVDVFEGLTRGNAQGLFLFDNAPSHQKRAPDAISAWKMPKRAFLFLFPLESCLLTWRSIAHADPKESWKPCADGPHMHDGRFSTGKSQSFYFPDNHLSMPSWFKGMAIIIAERGLWPADGLPAQCPSFRCPPGRTNCCCRQLLFLQ